MILFLWQNTHAGAGPGPAPSPIVAELDHSPADILRYALVALGVGTLPDDVDEWPIAVDTEPDEPESVITIKDTVGMNDGRVMFNGAQQLHPGVQVRIRAPKHNNGGWLKADSIRKAMNESVYQEEVTIDSKRYLLHCCSNVSQVIPLGKDVPRSKRSIFTINALVSVRALS